MEESKCANCGTLQSKAKSIIVSTSMYEGEWCCSKECADEHDKFGCPFEYSNEYRKR